MRARRRTLLATMVAVGMTVAVIPLVAGADTGSQGGLKWGDCSHNDVVEAAEPPDIPKDLECAAVAVPVDRDDPDGTVSVQISQLPYTGDGKPAGSVFVVPGGPGGAGTSDLIEVGDTFKNLREHYNVVGYDPRGHMLDKKMPLKDCLYNGPEFAAPKTREQFDKVHAKQRAAIEKCRSHLPRAGAQHVHGRHNAARPEGPGLRSHVPRGS